MKPRKKNPSSAVIDVPSVNNLLLATSPVWIGHDMEAGSPFSREDVERFIDYCAAAVRDAPDVQPPPGAHGVTLEVARTLGHRDVLYSRQEIDSRGEPRQARVNGKLKTWKTRPGAFELPMKVGLSAGFRIVGGEVQGTAGYDASQWSTQPDAGRGWVTVESVDARLVRGIPHQQESHQQSAELNLIGLTVRGELRGRHEAGFFPASTRWLDEEDWDPECLDLWRGVCRAGGWREERRETSTPKGKKAGARPAYVNCQSCEGTGFSSVTANTDCPDCNGTGRKRTGSRIGWARQPVRLVRFVYSGREWGLLTEREVLDGDEDVVFAYVDQNGVVTDELVTLYSFIWANPEEHEAVARLRLCAVGDSVNVGGGARPLITLERVQ